VMCYGGMTSIVMQAAEELLLEHEISCEILVPCCIKPLSLDGVDEALARSGRFVVVEEGPITGGWGAEVTARVQERFWAQLRAPVQRIGAKDGIIPSTRVLEDMVLPTQPEVVASIAKMSSERRM